MSSASQPASDTNEQKINDNEVCLKWNKKFIENYDTFIFDCDGVVWLSNDAIPGAKRVLNQLVSLKKRVLYLSNNSSKDITMYINKLNKLFDVNTAPNQIYSSAVAAASYISMILPQLQKSLKEVKILLVGAQGLYNIVKEEISQYDNVSIIWTSKDVPGLRQMKVSALADLKLDQNVAIIVAGIDTEYNYNDISLVCRYAHEMKHKVHIVGTNDDQTFPAKPGVFLAGTGSLLAAIDAVTPSPMKICGKPHKLLFDLIQQKHESIQADKCLMVGDRLSTDIAFGINCGMKTGLVMTGITTKDLLEKSDIKPTFVLPSIADLL